MTMRERISTIVLYILGIALLLWLALVPLAQMSKTIQNTQDYINTHESYSGKLVFYTEKDYSEFKLELAKPEVDFNSRNILVLSSDPPIVVQFYVNVPNGYKFPYGDMSK